MKKLKKLFSLIGILSLCIGMTLLTTNKINVNAQEVELSATIDLPLPSGFYVFDFDYPDNANLYFLYNVADNGGNLYDKPVTFTSTLATGEYQISHSMKQLIESTPRLINDVWAIKNSVNYRITSNASIDILVRPYFVYDVSTWFSDYTSRDLYYIQKISDTTSKLYVNDWFFLDLLDLADTQLKQYGIDISNALIDNAGIINADFIYNQGWNVGYDIGYDEGLDDGYDGGYNFGYSEGHNDGFSDGYEEGQRDVHSPTPVEYFLYEFNNWIVPAIAVAVFGGGLFMFFTRKREA